MNSQKAAIQQKYWICPRPKCITHLGGDSRKRVWKQREDVQGFRRKANKSHVIDLAIILESRESYHRSSNILRRMHFRISPPSNRRMRLIQWLTIREWRVAPPGINAPALRWALVRSRLTSPQCSGGSSGTEKLGGAVQTWGEKFRPKAEEAISKMSC